jgi:biotin synthase
MLIGGFPRARVREWLTTTDDSIVDDLYREADRVRREEVGDGVHLRGLIEISNTCGKDCLYCGLRRSNDAVERYKMSPDEVVGAAREAHALGYKSVVLQSGESGGYTVGEMADVVARIKKSTGQAITLSLGEKPREFYAAWKAAGADRYLLRFETSDPWLFRHFKPDGSRRIGCNVCGTCATWATRWGRASWSACRASPLRRCWTTSRLWRGLNWT